jgi:hypothetical protein
VKVALSSVYVGWQVIDYFTTLCQLLRLNSEVMSNAA